MPGLFKQTCSWKSFSKFFKANCWWSENIFFTNRMHFIIQNAAKSASAAVLVFEEINAKVWFIFFIRQRFSCKSITRSSSFDPENIAYSFDPELTGHPVSRL